MPNDINSYRLTSLEEPPEEYLAQIMREAAEDAFIRQEEATKKYFEEGIFEDINCEGIEKVIKVGANLSRLLERGTGKNRFKLMKKKWRKKKDYAPKVNRKEKRKLRVMKVLDKKAKMKKKSRN